MNILLLQTGEVYWQNLGMSGDRKLAGLIALFQKRCHTDTDQEETPNSPCCHSRSKIIWRGPAYFANYSLVTIHLCLLLVICSTFVAARSVPQTVGISEARNLMDSRRRDQVQVFGYRKTEPAASHDQPTPSSWFSTWTMGFSRSANMSMQRPGRHEKMKQLNNFKMNSEKPEGRQLNGPGSSPPSCRSKCGKCIPCKPVHVPIQPGKDKALEYYPEAWRCKCGNKLYMP